MSNFILSKKVSWVWLPYSVGGKYSFLLQLQTDRDENDREGKLITGIRGGNRQKSEKKRNTTMEEEHARFLCAEPKNMSLVTVAIEERAFP